MTIPWDLVQIPFSNKGFGVSPPVPIMSQPPSFAYSSPLCSTGTNSSAASSYSVDYDNNNHHNQNGEAAYSKSHEDESYVPWNPGEEQQASLNSLNSLTLPLNQDVNDYVETSLSKDSSSTQTPSSYMEMQSPMSPYDNHMPMSPGCTANTNIKNSATGKVSVSHSRNSSLIEENDGYVHMNPSSHTRCESGGCSTAGSTTELDDQYLDMDFGRKLNLSNEDVRRLSPASSESIQSGTPSSDFPLEKVSSYLTDDFDDTTSMRPTRCYSVGSRSDSSSMGKNRCGKNNRLEAVQETFRIRAMSVGVTAGRYFRLFWRSFSKTFGVLLSFEWVAFVTVGSKAKRPFVHPNSVLFASPNSVLPGGKSPSTSLSSSWSGSTGRWPSNKFINPPTAHGQISAHGKFVQQLHNYAGSESNDSDFMELDFSHNKSKSRKRSLPGPNGNPSTPSSAGSNSSSLTKISPVPKGLLCNGRDTPPKSESTESPKSTSSIITTTTNGFMNGIPAVPKYATSAPISIQKAKVPEVSYHDSPGTSILTKMTGMDLKKLKELDDEGAYLDMDFTNKSPEKSQQKTLASSSHQEIVSNLKNNFLNTRPVVIKANESPTACKISRFSLNSAPSTTTTNAFVDSLHSSTKTDTTASLVRSLSNSSNLSSISTHSNSSSNSSMSVKTQQEVETTRCCDTVAQPKTIQNSLSHSSTSDHASIAVATAPTTTSGLSRIEEYPEKQESKGHLTTQVQSLPRSPLHSSAAPDDDKRVTYDAIEHLPPVWRSYSSPAAASGPSCGSSAASKASSVAYAQIDFVKNAAETSLQSN